MKKIECSIERNTPQNRYVVAIEYNKVYKIKSDEE